jgi:steroid delta-isomerase
MTLTNRALLYFHNFSTHNITGLANQFSEHVTLRDWDQAQVGKQQVLAANQRIWDSTESIVVTPLAVYEQGHTVAAELLITVNRTEHIWVTDIIDFDDQGLITAVRAYKG